MMMFGSGVCITHAMLSRISAFFYVSSWIAGETRREMCMCVFMLVRSDTGAGQPQLPAPPWSGGTPTINVGIVINQEERVYYKLPKMDGDGGKSWLI